MSWSPIDPPPIRKSTLLKSSVTVSMLGDSKRFAPILRMVIRGNQLDVPAPWLKAGTSLSVMAGHGEHAGKVRITPNGSFLLAAASGKAKADTFTLRLPIPAGVQHDRKTATPCEVRCGAGWLEVTLPEWARPAAPPPPRVGISERIADPVTALRGPGAHRR